MFVPSVERDGVTAVDQPRWVNGALEMFGRVFGGATAYPKAQGIWRDDERSGALVKDEPVVVHCYTTPADIEDARNLAELGDFCRRMGRDARQGEVGLVVGDEYFAIRDFAEEYQHLGAFSTRGCATQPNTVLIWTARIIRLPCQ